MLHAAAVDQALAGLTQVFAADDVIIDGGNSFYRHDVVRAEALKPRQIHYVDVGTSGGVWGLARGFCQMIGGPEDVVRRLDPIFAALAPTAGEAARTPGREGPASTAERGYLHCGPS